MTTLNALLALDAIARQSGSGLKPALRKAIEAQIDQGSDAPDQIVDLGAPQPSEAKAAPAAWPAPQQLRSTAA